jgi:hypothetical protein
MYVNQYVNEKKLKRFCQGSVKLVSELINWSNMCFEIVNQCKYPACKCNIGLKMYQKIIVNGGRCPNECLWQIDTKNSALNWCLNQRADNKIQNPNHFDFAAEMDWRARRTSTVTTILTPIVLIESRRLERPPGPLLTRGTTRLGTTRMFSPG